MWFRRLLKILHTLGAAGLAGGFAAYMVLLFAGPQDTPQAYADTRASIAAISNYMIVPSLGLTLVTGVFAMAAHTPFIDRGWVWLKGGLGLLMFESSLAIVGAKAREAEDLSARMVTGDLPADALDAALANEWYALIALMALTVAQIVLGVWRPRLMRSGARGSKRTPAATS